MLSVTAAFGNGRAWWSAESLAMRASITSLIRITASSHARKWLVTLLTLCALSVHAQDGQDASRQPPDRPALGPIVSQNLHPMYAPFVQLPARSARTVGQNSIATFIHESYGNNYFFHLDADDDDGGDTLISELDTEASYTTLGLTWGIHPRAEVNGSLLFVSHFDGVFDPAIEAYHDLLGLPNAGRGKRPQNEFSLYFKNDSGELLDEEGPIMDITALNIEPRVNLVESEDERFLLTVGSTVKLSLSSPAVTATNSGADVALRAFAEYRWPRADLSASTGVAYLSQPDYIPDASFRPWIIPFTASFEWMLSDGFSLGTTISGNTSPFDLGYDRTDRFTATATMGGIFALGEQTQLQIATSQEFFTFAATDVAVHLALSYAFAEPWEPRQ